ncbi:MAG: hypothetical protein K6T29_09075, partial [Peptococcaceae bacterium]|nr:hypothetical protein [Peptococcaceae bacterium]
MPEAIIGNSKMLVCLRGNGEIFRLFWPHIDYGQHLGLFWPGIRLALPEGHSYTKWFHLNVWESSQRYLEDTNIVETTLTSQAHHLKVTQWDFVFPHQDVLARHYELKNEGEKSQKLTFILYCAFEIEESVLYDGAYLDFTSNSLVFFRRNVYLAVAGSGYPLAGYQCGRRGTPSDPFQEASRGFLWGTGDNIRHSAGSLAWDLGELQPGEAKTFTLHLAAGQRAEEVQALLAGAAARNGEHWLAETRRYWHGWLQAGLQAAGECSGHPAYKRSLLAMKLMTSRDTGASIAAPEFDPYYLACGGYGYCWPRDSVYIAAALDEAGYHDLAGQFYLFASSVQDRDGSWHQRYFTDGSVAPTWGKQIDQVGTVLWGYRHHHRLTGDDGFLERIWPSLTAGAGYLTGSLDAGGLPSPSYDPWEDEYAQGTYPAAAVCSGLKAASELAARRGEKDAAERWRRAAETVREAILAHQWSPRHNRFVRGINRRVGRETYEQALSRGEGAFTGTDPGGLYQNYWVSEDPRVDAALLGLAFPFAVLDPLDERMQATARAVEERLWNYEAGGLHRYEGDGYRGGNPWLLTTFWLAIY